MNTTTYTGREFDSESSMYFYRARFYMPEIGRFIQKDPHPGDLENVGVIINQYSYVSNSPFNLVDPSGKFGFLTGLAIVVGAGIIGGFVDVATHGWDWKYFGQGFVMGAALGSAFLGASAILGGAFAGFSSAGIAAPSTAAYLVAGALAGPATIGLFAPNAFGGGSANFFKSYARDYLIAGAAGNILQAINTFTYGTGATKDGYLEDVTGGKFHDSEFPWYERATYDVDWRETLGIGQASLGLLSLAPFTSRDFNKR